MDMWVPLKEKKQNKNIKRDGQQPDSVRIKERYFFFFSLVNSQIYENLTVGFRRDKHEKCSTRRGLHVGTRNTGFHQEFS